MVNITIIVVVMTVDTKIDEEDFKVHVGSKKLLSEKISLVYYIIFIKNNKK